MRRKLYVWWLYHGPGFKNIRRSLRINDEILPIRGVVRDAHFDAMAVEAEHAVAELRSEVIDHSQVRGMPQEGQIAKILGPRRLVVANVVTTGDVVGGFTPRKVESQNGLWERERARIEDDRAADAAYRKLHATPDDELNEAQMHDKYDGPSGR